MKRACNVNCVLSWAAAVFVDMCVFLQCVVVLKWLQQYSPERCFTVKSVLHIVARVRGKLIDVELLRNSSVGIRERDIGGSPFVHTGCISVQVLQLYYIRV